MKNHVWIVIINILDSTFYSVFTERPNDKQIMEWFFSDEYRDTYFSIYDWEEAKILRICTYLQII